MTYKDLKVGDIIASKKIPLLDFVVNIDASKEIIEFMALRDLYCFGYRYNPFRNVGVISVDASVYRNGIKIN